MGYGASLRIPQSIWVRALFLWVGGRENFTYQRGGRGRIQCCCKKSTKARTFGRSRRVRSVRMLNGVGGR